MKKIDLSSVSLKNLKSYLYQKGKGNNDIEYFGIKINENEIKIPIEIAICYSTKILELLSKDSTIREYHFNIEFHNPNIIHKIIEILTDENQTKVVFNCQNDEDFIDFLLFCQNFGYEEFTTYFKEYIYTEFQQLNIENCLKILSYFNVVGHLENVEKIISFLSSHFYELIDNKEFYLWCCNVNHYSYVESIISNDVLQINNENELLTFIVKLCKTNKEDCIYEHLLRYVYLEYCDIETIKKFINYLSNQKEEFQSESMQIILGCFCRRLTQNKLPIPITNEHKQRYYKKGISKYITISSNTGKIIPEKYYQQINEKSYKFLYPSKNSSDCKSVFKLILKQGKYHIECIGASGGKGSTNEGGFGGYSSGILSVSEEISLFLFIGGQGSSIKGTEGTYSPGGFNGGGGGRTGTKELNAGSGGGCTDIRMNSEKLEDRIIVAGGGGGSAGCADGGDNLGGNAGGLNGSNGTTHNNYYGTGGSQNMPGYCSAEGKANSGKNNVGGDAHAVFSSGGGGGGGYYGGGGGDCGGGGGGSGYVSDKLESGIGIIKETKEFTNIGNGYIIISLIK